MSFALDTGFTITKRADDVVEEFVPSVVGGRDRNYGNELKMLVDDEYNSSIRGSFRTFSSTPYQEGAFVLGGMSIIDEWGFVFRESDGCCPLGIPGFGWNDEHLSHLVRIGRMRSGKVDRSFYMNYTVSERRPLDGTSLLLSFPGALTYGHWYFDVVGRFLSVNKNIRKTIDQYLLPARWFSWMDRFVNVMGISKEDIAPLDDQTLYHCERLIVPSVPSQGPGGVVPYNIMRETQVRFAQLYDSWTRPTNTLEYDLCVLRHTPITSIRTRILSNYDEFCQRAAARGFKILDVDPLKRSFADTLRSIENTKLCIGQDSSALHNIICVPRDLIVIETERRANMLHCCIQAACDRGIGYLGAQKEAGKWLVNPDMVLDIVSTVLDKK
jgi:hypothetical protein